MKTLLLVIPIFFIFFAERDLFATEWAFVPAPSEVQADCDVQILGGQTSNAGIIKNLSNFNNLSSFSARPNITFSEEHLERVLTLLLQRAASNYEVYFETLNPKNQGGPDYGSLAPYPHRLSSFKGTQPSFEILAKLDETAPFLTINPEAQYGSVEELIAQMPPEIIKGIANFMRQMTSYYLAAKGPQFELERGAFFLRATSDELGNTTGDREYGHGPQRGLHTHQEVPPNTIEFVWGINSQGPLVQLRDGRRIETAFGHVAVFGGGVPHGSPKREKPGLIGVGRITLKERDIAPPVTSHRLNAPETVQQLRRFDNLSAFFVQPESLFTAEHSQTALNQLSRLAADNHQVGFDISYGAAKSGPILGHMDRPRPHLTPFGPMQDTFQERTGTQFSSVLVVSPSRGTTLSEQVARQIPAPVVASIGNFMRQLTIAYIEAKGPRFVLDHGQLLLRATSDHLGEKITGFHIHGNNNRHTIEFVWALRQRGTLVKLQNGQIAETPEGHAVIFGTDVPHGSPDSGELRLIGVGYVTLKEISPSN